MGRNKLSIRKRWLKIIWEKKSKIALNVLYVKKEKIYAAYVSKHNSNREKQIILLLIISNYCHYLGVKKLSALLRGITSKNSGDFYCFDCLNSFRTKDKLESYKKVCEIKKIFYVIMPSENTKILEFNQNQKSDKAPLIIHADFDYIIQDWST